MEIRDPIHGAIRVTETESVVIDHPFVQRLRGVRSTGFAYLPFPGATHSRYSHSLGVMHLAGKAFDRAYENWSFADPKKREMFRSCVRLGALTHDLGHAPYSHCSEFAMPPLADLKLDFYGKHVNRARRATHEDYTIAILERTSLRQAIESNFDLEARHVAALVSHDVPVSDDFFLDDGLDHRRMLSQLISSELDVDRLDYLVRDSYYSGARYGQIDVNWLISNMRAMPVEGDVTLALDSRAIYAFDDFMIARHHMFLMVYFHHKSVVYEELLKRHVTAPDCPWGFDGDLDKYLWQDDIWLDAMLRTCSDPWARRITEHRPFRRVLEKHGNPEEIDLDADVSRLQDAGIDIIVSGSTGKLSRYNVYGQKRSKSPQVHVVEGLTGQPVERVRPLSDVSRVFEAYAKARRIARIYAAPEDVERARQVLGLPTAP